LVEGFGGGLPPEGVHSVGDAMKSALNAFSIAFAGRIVPAMSASPQLRVQVPARREDAPGRRLQCRLRLGRAPCVSWAPRTFDRESQVSRTARRSGTDRPDTACGIPERG